MKFQFLNAQPGLRASNLDSAASFYEQLGFQSGHRSEDIHQVMQKDSVVIHLSTVEGGPASVQIVVDSVDELYDIALSLKLDVLYDGLGDRRWGCRDFTIEDPDGNRITFSQEL